MIEPEVPAVSTPPDSPTADQAKPGVPADVWRVLAPLTVFATVNSTDALLLQHAGDVRLSTPKVVAAYVGFNIVYAALGYPAGKLADKVSPRVPFAMGLVVFAVVYIGLGQSATTTAVWVLLPLYGIFPALTDGIAGPGSPTSRPPTLAPGCSASTAQPPGSRCSSPGCGAASRGDTTARSRSPSQAASPPQSPSGS